MSEQSEQLAAEELAAEEKATEEAAAAAEAAKNEDLTEVEQEQMEHGWTPKNEWVEGGGDPDEWRTAAHFKTIGENVRYRNENKSLRDNQTKFDKRLSRNEALFEESTKQLIADLEAQRDVHTDAGELEESKAVQKRIDDAKDATRPGAAVDDATDSVIVAWNDANPWIDNPGAKADYAKALYNRGLEKGLSSQEIVDFVDEEVSKEYGKGSTTKVINARRTEASTTQASKAKSGKTSNLSVSDLTADEKSQRDHSDYLSGMDDQKFLKIVERSRRKEAEENK